MDNAALIQEVTKKKRNVWLNGDYDAETKKGVKNLLDNPDKTDLIEAFYKDLEFERVDCVASWVSVPTV